MKTPLENPILDLIAGHHSQNIESRGPRALGVDGWTRGWTMSHPSHGRVLTDVLGRLR